MPDLKPYTGPTKLVIAFDIGTTFSGISYCILERGRVPEILGVSRFLAQELVRGGPKVPSLLYYDQSGNVMAAGAEVLAEGKTEAALTEGWARAEWWKLHLRPKHLASSIKLDDDLPPLPPGKSAVDVLSDFIRYLFQCAKIYIQERHLAFTWPSIEDSIQYVFTHPNGREGVQQLYRQAIAHAGLIPATPEGQSRVRMLTEGEASLHFCVSNLLSAETATQASPRGVVIIDVGGVTIDLSMFSMTSSPISCEEIAPAECRLQGSVFVTRRARALLQRKLDGWQHSSPEDIAEFTREFDQSTKLVIKNNQEPAYVRVAERRTSNSKYNILFGKLKLSGEEATGLFNETVDAIINAFEQQQKSASTPVTMAFLVGGLSTNDWFWSQLQSYFGARSINIYRPDNHINKVVTNGAVLSHVDRDNHPVASLEKTVNSLRIEEESPNSKIAHLEETVAELHTKLANKAEEADGLNKTIDSLRSVLSTHEQKHQCEVLYAQGRINDAAESLIQITTTASEAVRANKLIMDWLTEFTHRCASTLEIIGDEASNAKKHDEAIAAYSTTLSLSPSIQNTVLAKWASSILIHGSANEALGATAKFKLPKFVIFRAICDVLEGDGRVLEAIACFRQMESELAEDTGFHDERARWKLDFHRRCTERLEKLGDAAMDSQNYDGAAEYFSTMLSLDLVDRMDVFIKRSKARASMKLWEEALSDANEAIKLDASCYRGYKLRHAALHGAGHHPEAVEAFDAMLRKIKNSPDEDIRQLRHRYVDARPTIHRIVAQTVRPMPRVLIDTTTGRLYDKKQQAEAFETLPIYSELVSSMTIQLDYARILGAVKECYQYVMLSHKWEHDEPLIQKVENISIYDLEASSANIKLQKFCLLVRSLGFRWAWSDTCCVDKSNNVILQESLVAMFTWYRGSSLTVVYLRGVSSEAQLQGDLQGSIWNTRAWTYQEYVAAEIIQFYTEDWKPYLGLTLPNHKESPVILSEMHQATGVSAQEMAVLRPGLDRVREKLFLASRRETTLVEDIAYSLFGIFNVAIPVIYGEGNRAVGRLLEHIASGSGDVMVLAWTGSAGSYNSCLPMDLTVYDQLMPPHVPLPMETAEMRSIITELRSSLPDLPLVTRLYNQLNKLPLPSLVASRLKLHGIVFPFPELLHVSELDSKTGLRVYRATTSAFGDVEIKTTDDLAGMKDLCFVHPWIPPLLDQEFSHGAAALDKPTQALRFLARLRQPFGALLFQPLSRVEYRRVATDSLIIAQIREEVSLTELIDSICMIEIQ